MNERNLEVQDKIIIHRRALCMQLSPRDTCIHTVSPTEVIRIITMQSVPHSTDGWFSSEKYVTVFKTVIMKCM